MRLAEIIGVLFREYVLYSLVHGGAVLTSSMVAAYYRCL